MQRVCQVFYNFHLPKILYSVQVFSAALRKLEAPQSFPAYEAEHIDRNLHVWHAIELPKGWATFFGGGKLRLVWKDHGYGRAKGHIWVRIFPSETWLKLSPRVASHYWRNEVLILPGKLFEEQHHKPGVLQFAAESHYSDNRVGYDMTGYEVHIAEGAKLLLHRRNQNDKSVTQETTAEELEQMPQNIQA